MKIYLVDLKWLKKATALFVLLAVSLAITVGILFAVDTYIYPAITASASGGKAKIKTVIIDPGHGGEDCGAIGADGTYEKDVNLKIAELMRIQLEERGYTVVMTRTEDKMLYSEDENIKGMRKLSDLKNRCKIASEHPDAILISVHMNSFGAEKYSGLQVYYTPKNDDSRNLAQSVQTKVRTEVQQENNRAVKSGENLYILEHSPITSIIVECGFLSNAEECRKLSEKEYQNRLSLAIVCGIIEYIEAK